MASPFRLFRKYQTTLLVVAGVVLMFVFVIGDPLMSYMRSGSGGGGGGGVRSVDVAVRWDGGKLTNAEISQLVMQRRVVNAFLQQVEIIGYQTAMEAGRDPGPLRVDRLLLPERPDQSVERDVLRVVLFADAARNAGMRVSDDQLLRYLRQLGRGYVTADQLRALISRLQVSGGGASIDYVLNGIREAMLARNYLASYAFALDTVLPEQRWQDWLRVNDRVVVEAAAIPIESFLVDVPEPSEAELSAFYEEFKSNEPLPESVGGIEMPSPNPAFAVPRKIELHYVRADYDKLIERAAAEVSDEEIEKFYEDNKDPYFIRADTSLLDDAASADEVEVVNEDTEIDELTPAKTPPDESEDATPADGDQSSINRSRQQSVFRLAAFAEETADDQSSASDGKKTEANDSGDTASGESSGLPEKPVEFQPLAEVRDQIRRDIAQVKVTEQLEKTFGEIEGELSHLYATYLGKVLDAEEAGQETPPPPPELGDLTSLAETHGFVYERTAPISVLELRELPIGMSVKPDEEYVPFFAIAFRDDQELYEPVVTRDSNANRYLAMKAGDTPGSVPALEEIRDEVVLAWRRQRAAELALKHAEAEAKKAEAVDSLEEYFAGDADVTVTKTDPFSWLTPGTVSSQTGEVQSFRYSKPEGIVNADTNVMQTIFDLNEEEVKAVLNHDHSIAYVVRIAEHEQSPAELQMAYLSEATRWYGLRAMDSSHARIASRAVYDDLLATHGVEWIREPDQPLRIDE